MPEETKQKVADYLSSHLYLNLATAGADGSPLAHTVAFVSEDATIYFITDKKTRKVKNIKSNPAVAFTVDEDYDNLSKIQGIQMTGRASLVTTASDAEKVMGMMVQKYPYMKELPENPDYVIFMVQPVEAQFIDNTAGFGHRDIVTY